MQQASLKELVKWIWRGAQGVRWRVAVVCLIGIARVGASLCFVWVSKMLIDAATLQSTPISHIWHLAGLLIGMLLLEMVMAQTSNYFSALTLMAMNNSLRRRIYDHLMRSDFYTDRKHSGDILNRITVDIASVVNMAVVTLPSILVMMVQLMAAFWLLCHMSPMLALCALIITPICIITSKAYMRKMRRINNDIRQNESEIHTNLQEGLQHRIVVQTLECAPEMSHRLLRLQGSLWKNAVTRARINLFSRATVRLGFITGYLVAFIWSVFQLHTGAITFGVMTAFLQLVARIQNPISSLSSTVPGIIGTATAIDRLIELEQGEVTHDDHRETFSGRVGVRVSDVSFRYATDAHEVLSHFNYDFAPGSKTVIMGETGIGKSTLTKLILAMLRPQSGVVEIYDDTHAVAVSAATRCNMVYVPQGNSLLEGSIKDNLLLANTEATDQQLRDVLHLAVANFVYDLPLGLDTPCGELGSELSEGQCQRIAIARALLRNGNILILDEFNSSLDETTAATLMQRLIASRPDATIIFISHRPEVATLAGATVLRITKNE